MTTPASKLRELLAAPGLISMPCCFDALSARLIERAGFPLTFMSGFAVSAARLAQPDTGLISYGEMLDQGRNLCGAVSIPVSACMAIYLLIAMRQVYGQGYLTTTAKYFILFMVYVVGLVTSLTGLILYTALTL